MVEMELKHYFLSTKKLLQDYKYFDNLVNAIHKVYILNYQLRLNFHN